MVATAWATGAISWSLSVAGWFTAPVLSRLLNQCCEKLGLDVTKYLIDLPGKLEKLETTILPQLLILTGAVEQSGNQPLLEKWLQNLKAAIYEVEHALGLVEYESLEKEVNFHFPSTSKSNNENITAEFLDEQGEEMNSASKSNTENIIQTHFERIMFGSSVISNIEIIKEKLLEISSAKKNLIISLNNLEKVVDEANKLVPALQLQSSMSNSTRAHNKPNRKSTISAPVDIVIGREKDREHIIKLLRDNPSDQSTSYAKCFSVIGIWGMGGSGKTTLAQYVYEYEDEAKYFDCVLWAHVSDQKFSAHSILEKIWESAFKKECPKYRGTEGLQSELQKKLSGERFFLVLDDVWCDKWVEELEKLFAPLRAGKRGSKILVTTRIEEAARVMGCMNPIPLRDLDKQQFFKLFMINALGDAQISDCLHEELMLIGEEIVPKLSRSPLAAKLVAGQLRKRLDPDFWSFLLKSSLLEDTMGALYLSYQHLDPWLQRCFAFCSLFPKGQPFSRNYLVDLWIAEGFIETKDGNEHIIANWYISDLISSSFFQGDKFDLFCSLHDLMHDLARYVVGGEFVTIEDGEKKEIPAHTRHIYVVDKMLVAYVDQMCKLEGLCTLIVSISFCDFSLEEVNFDTLFAKLRKLRVLEIDGIDLKRVHNSVAQLKNLRYLKFKEAEGDENFNSVNKLYQLRFLHTNSQIPHVGKLISLRHLETFYVRERSGFELKQLKHLNLCSSLSLYGLGSVKSKEEADQAKLSGKEGLHKLFFNWEDVTRESLRDNDV